MRFGQQALGDCSLRAHVQKPGVERRATHHIQVCARRVCARCEGTAVLAVLHVGANQRNFSVGRMQNAGGTLKRQESGLQLKCSQRRLAFFEHVRPLLQKLGSDFGGCTHRVTAHLAGSGLWPHLLHKPAQLVVAGGFGHGTAHASHHGRQENRSEQNYGFVNAPLGHKALVLFKRAMRAVPASAALVPGVYAGLGALKFVVM